MTGDSVFKYPGNKASEAEAIVATFPDHRVYVEPFGGAAGVLANKPQSHTEVYNDVDGDLVQFFDVLRDRGDELVDWLELLPYSREKYEQWADSWYDEDWRPDDPVQRAGVFYYLRATSFGGKYRYKGGFATSTVRNQARTYSNGIDRLRAFADRFAEVAVENLGWRECIDQYDTEETLFYCDPPYRETVHRYRHGNDFDHDAFAGVLSRTAGEWVVSYDAIPESVRSVATTTTTKTVTSTMGVGVYDSEAPERNESLAFSFDPDDVDRFVDAQTGLQQFLEERDPA